MKAEIEYIVPECFADTTLIYTLINRRPRHQKGISKVKKNLTAFAGKYKVVIGIVDNDKNEQQFFNTLTPVDNSNPFILHKKLKNQHYLILNPAIEEFILHCCNEVEIDITNEKYGLSSELKQLGRILKSPAIEYNQKFKKLISDLELAQSPTLLLLKTRLQDLMQQH